jgi:hypothetical protein
LGFPTTVSHLTDESSAKKEYELTLKDQFFVLLGRLGNVTAAASQLDSNRGRAIGGPGTLFYNDLPCVNYRGFGT